MSGRNAMEAAVPQADPELLELYEKDSRVKPSNPQAAILYIQEVTDALWEADRLALSARQIGALEDVIRVASDHRLHRRWIGRRGSRCLICESYERLRVTTAEATS